MEKIFSLGEVSRMTGVLGHKIAYAITIGELPEPRFRFLGKRCFTTKDVKRVAEHFGVNDTSLSPEAVKADHVPLSHADLMFCNGGTEHEKMLDK